MIYVMSDLHGCPAEKVERLLEKASFSDGDDLFILGDVIDRGKHGVELLKWIMRRPNVFFILGNHEAMMLACDFLISEITDESVYGITSDTLRVYMDWIANGGQYTVDALSAISPEERREIFDFLADAPLFDTVSVGERDCIFTHSGLGGFDKTKKLRDYPPDALLWHRPNPDERYFDDVTVVFGHTPTRYLDASADGHVIVTETWINVDGGCSCGNDPVLLRLDDMTEFTTDGERRLQ